MANHKRKKRKIKTYPGYLPGDGPRGNMKSDQTKQEKLLDLKGKEAEFLASVEGESNVAEGP